MEVDAEVDVQHEVAPIDVRVVNAEKDLAADFGSWATYVFVGTEQAVVLLPQSPKRDRAVILVQGTAGANVGVRVGTIGQVQAGQGGMLLAPITVVVESQPEIYMAPLGAAVTVTVLDERYR